MRLPGIFCLLLLSTSAFAKVGITDHTGDILPTKNLYFHDEAGKNISLDTYFHNKKPVILVPVFYHCSSVCNVVLSNLVTALKQMNPSVDRAFDLIVFSFDEKDMSALALAKKNAYLRMYARPETADGWHFLTGDKENIASLTRALGFDFELDPTSGQFSHSAALFILSPEAKLTAVIAGTTYPHKELQMALLEATQGRVQIFLNRISALCYTYMPHPGILNSPLRWLVVVAGFLVLCVIILVLKYKK